MRSSEDVAMAVLGLDVAGQRAGWVATHNEAAIRIELYVQERVDAATREQAALLRECKESLDDALTYSDHSSFCPGAVMPKTCHCWRVKARALLLRLPASDGEAEEKREEPQRVECECNRDRMGHPYERGRCVEGRILGHKFDDYRCRLHCRAGRDAHYAPSPTPDAARGQRAEGGGE